MMGYAGGMGAGSWVLMGLVWLTLIVFIVWMVVSIMAQTHGVSQTQAVSRGLSPTPRTADTPMDILDLRIARGEIDLETYESLRSKLAEAR